MNSKVLNKAKHMLDDYIKITKETDEAIFFKVDSFKGSYNVCMKTQAPQWLKEFENKFNDFKTNQEQFNSRQEQFNSRQEQFNSRQEQFNVRLEKRIDNLVSKNKLVE